MTGPRARGSERGTALYFLVLTVVLAASSGYLLRGNFQALLRERPRGKQSLAARWAAEGGIAKARVALRGDAGWKGGSVEVGRGRAEVTVREVPGEASLREIVSVADFPAGAPDTIRARRRVAARVRLGGDLPAVVSWEESPP